MRRAPTLLLALAFLASVTSGCARARLHEVRETNRTLEQQNADLKRQLDETRAELNRTRIALDRAQAELAAARSAR